MTREKIRLALSILSGRFSIESFGWEEWDTLGFDAYKFGAFGRPGLEDIRSKAEEIILEAICDHGHGAARGFLGGPPARNYEDDR